MINSEVWQQKFIEQYKQKVLTGKIAEDTPKFVYLLGAKGSGKTTLARKMNNVVLASADDIIAEFIKAKGYDGRTYNYGAEESCFFSKVLNEVFEAAIANRYNIVFDTGLTDNTEKLIEKMERRGYKSEIKAILVDDIVAQLNVVARKLEFDNKFTMYKEGKENYPENLNPTQVSIDLAKKSAVDVANFLQELDKTGQNFEVYEYGDDIPSYSTRDSRISFADYLEDFCSRLPEEKSYLGNVDQQINLAVEMHNVEAALSLLNLRKQLIKAENLKEAKISDLALDMIERASHSVDVLERDIEDTAKVKKGGFVPKKIGKPNPKKVNSIRGKKYGR